MSTIDEPISESVSLSPSIQDRVNMRVYHAPGIEHAYSRSDELEAGEVAALLKYQPAVSNRDVLDVGVGAGRTTPYLMQLAKSYVAIDYSPIMVECFKHKFQDVPIRCEDMRNLSFLAAESIDFALASCNVLDAVSHEHRLIVLRQLHRVLRPQGIILFSSHNRSFLPALRGPQLRRSLSPCNQARYVVQFVRQHINHFSTGKLRRFERDYALLDDIGHDYRLLHYYIDRASQHRQLAQCGFETLAVYTNSGRLAADGDQAADSPILYYVAAKAKFGDRSAAPR